MINTTMKTLVLQLIHLTSALSCLLYKIKLTRVYPTRGQGPVVSKDLEGP